MGRTWTPEELRAVSEYNKKRGLPGYEEFCAEPGLKAMPTCPVCGRMYAEPPALSRRDNRTLICPACGTKEAIEDFLDHKAI